MVSHVHVFDRPVYADLVSDEVIEWLCSCGLYPPQPGQPLTFAAVSPGKADGGAPLATQTKRTHEDVGSSRVDLQACKLEYSIVSPK